MPRLNKHKLLNGPYTPPKVAVGHRAACLSRGCVVRVTSWTNASVPWPKGVPVGGTGQPSIIVTEELARAVRCESSLAVSHHFGVSTRVVWAMRKGLGVTRASNEGTRHLRKEVSERVAQKRRGVPLSAERRERMRRTAIANDQGRFLRGGRRDAWTTEELTLLGTDSDAAVASRIGRTAQAVTAMRCRRKIKPYPPRRSSSERSRIGTLRAQATPKY
jgi:hypothetical protein